MQTDAGHPLQHQQHDLLRPPRPCLDSTSRSDILHQVATIANGVMRLTRKMQNVGLTAGERSLLDFHMSLLEHNVVELQPVVLATNHASSRNDRLDQHSDYHSSPHTSDDESSSPSSPRHTSTHTGTSPRRRTKRIFSDRSCQHCDTQYTSQWRTGPSGPSTLCNACGIRYARQVKQERAAHKLLETKGQASSNLSLAVDLNSRRPVTATVAPVHQTGCGAQQQSAAPNRSSVSFLLN